MYIILMRDTSVHRRTPKKGVCGREKIILKRKMLFI